MPFYLEMSKNITKQRDIYDTVIFRFIFQLYFSYIYINKKAQKNILKFQIFLFFSEALSMYKKITNENTDNSATQ